MANDNNKEIANSLSKYSDYKNKSINIALDGVNQISQWYIEHLNKISENDITNNRLETSVDNSDNVDNEVIEEKIDKIETKVNDYDELQTVDNIKKSKKYDKKRIQTLNEKENNNTDILDSKLKDNSNKINNKKNSKITTVIKGTKFVNNATNRIIKMGRNVNNGLNEDGSKNFEEISSRIMTRPVKKVANSMTKKTTKFVGKKSVKATKKLVQTTQNILVKSTKFAIKIVEKTAKTLMVLFPSIAPMIIIILIIAAICNFFDFKNTQEANNVNFDEIASIIVEIQDVKLQAIYNEFLKNKGKPYLMDHNNLSHDTCMDYYDCSSFVIHCLAHTGIKTIPNTDAKGIYNDYCTPIEVNNRQAGDLIFLKDTYDTGEQGGISHVGIYMGELTINGDTGEWVIDTGGNPEGVKIRKYNNGWWNGEKFYGFGRLK